jgi:hypothetical protein
MYEGGLGWLCEWGRGREAHCEGLAPTVRSVLLGK